MPSMEQVPVRGFGGFSVQYTDSAQKQAARLDDDLMNRLHGHLNMVAAVNPQLHGKQQSGFATADRRVIEFESLVVSLWLSMSVKLITVVDIQRGDRPVLEEGPGPESSGGFTGFDDENLETGKPQMAGKSS